MEIHFNKKEAAVFNDFLYSFGGLCGARTHGILVVTQVLSQLS